MFLGGKNPLNCLEMSFFVNLAEILASLILPLTRYSNHLYITPLRGDICQAKCILVASSSFFSPFVFTK